MGVLTRVLTCVACFWAVARAGGGLDRDFHPAFTTTQGTVLYTLALQSDGKVLVSGEFALFNGESSRVVARLLPDGTLDDSFDIGTGVDGLVYAMAIQPADGRILIGGQFRTCRGCPRLLIARLNPDGTHDDSFQPSLRGAEGSFVSALVVQPDGRILAGGSFEAADGFSRRGIVRFLPSGRADHSFDPGSGIAGGRVHDLALQADGRILVAGAFAEVGGRARSGLARLEGDGQLDSSFYCRVANLGGPAIILTVSWHPVRGIVIGGVFDEVGGLPRVGLAKLQQNGGVDSTFDPQGGIAGAPGVPYDAVTLPDGAVMVTGSFWQVAGVDRSGVARLDSTGAPDPAFEPGDGLAPAEDAFGNMLAVQADGRVLVAGQFEEIAGVRRHCLARLLADGKVDPTFLSTNSQFEFGGCVRAIAPLRDGGVLVGGQFERVNGGRRHALARLNAHGGLVESFDVGLDRGAVIHAVAVRSDGRVLVGGEFERVGDAERANVACLLPDGALDPAFAVEGADASVRAFALLPDGRVVVAGEFRQFGEMRRFGVVRLEPDGTPDAGFEPRFEVGLDRAMVLALALQPDGRMVAGGYFDSVNGQPRNAVARVLPDGALDEGFEAALNGLAEPPLVTSLVLRSDGRLLVGGRFHAVARSVREGLARLYTDGRLDGSFDAGGGIRWESGTRVEALGLVPDGQLAVGGDVALDTATGSPSFALLSNLGSLPSEDSAFATPEGPVHAIAIEPDGSLLIGGAFEEAFGQTRLGLVRVAAPPRALERRIAVTGEHDGVRVHWDGGGRLFESSTLPGRWHEVREASSPFSPALETGERFYRWAE